MVGVSKSFQNNKQVLKNIYLSFFYGAKIGIIGLNGSGKSTLLKIIAGLEKSYQGEVVFSPGYSVGYLAQEPYLDNTKTVKEIVMEGVQPSVDALKRSTRSLVCLSIMKTRIKWICSLPVRENYRILLMLLMPGIWIVSWNVLWMLFVVPQKIN